MAGKISKTSYSIPGGNVKQLQYNDTGLFGGCAQLFWDKTTNRLGINTSTMVETVNISGATRSVMSFLDEADDSKLRVGVSTSGAMLYGGNPAGTLKFLIRAYSVGGVQAYFTAGNVGIGTTTPATSALLDLTSTTGALLLSRMTTTQGGNLTPVNGMTFYDLTLNKFRGYENGNWINLSGRTNLTEFVDQTAWRLFYSNADGNVTELALGTDGQYLKSNGVAVAPSWDAGGGVAGADTQVQFNDGGAFGSDTGLVFNKTKNKLTAGVHWDAGYPFDSFEATVEGVSEAGEWGVLGASRSSDYGGTGSMRCLGLYGFVQNNSNTGAYGLYVEARKEVSVASAATLGAEIVILNRYNSQVDVTPSSNPAQATYGLSLTSGVTYDAVTDYDASVALYLDQVGAKFRRGIVMSSSALRDHGGGKYIAIALPDSARIAWYNDNNCIMGTSTIINTLIANSVITTVNAAGLGVTGVVVATTKVQGGNVYMQNNAIHLDANDVVVSASSNNMYLAAGGTTQAILYATTGNLSLGGVLAENQWTLDIKSGNHKWDLLDSIRGAYKAHSGENLDELLKTESNGRRPSDFIQVAIECVADLHKRIEVLENG